MKSQLRKQDRLLIRILIVIAIIIH